MVQLLLVLKAQSHSSDKAVSYRVQVRLAGYIIELLLLQLHATVKFCEHTVTTTSKAMLHWHSRGCHEDATRKTVPYRRVGRGMSSLSILKSHSHYPRTRADTRRFAVFEHIESSDAFTLRTQAKCARHFNQLSRHRPQTRLVCRS